MNNGQHPQHLPLSADAYPVGVFGGDRRITPDKVYADASETTLMLWIGGDMIQVVRNADDTKLQAALHLARHLSQMAERFGVMVRAELEQRQRARTAEPIAAAAHAAAGGRPAPDMGEAAFPNPADTPRGMRYCTGCGAQLRPATPEEIAAAAAATKPADTRRDCPECRVAFLAEQMRARAGTPPVPAPPPGAAPEAVLTETALMPTVDPDPNGDRPR